MTKQLEKIIQRLLKEINNHHEMIVFSLGDAKTIYFDILNLQSVNSNLNKIIDELKPSEIPCYRCKGEVHEFSVPNELWNLVIRKGGKETNQEYLCFDCWNDILLEYVKGVADIKNEITRLRSLVTELKEDAEATENILRDNHLCIQQENDDLVLECTDCCTPYDEGHSRDCNWGCKLMKKIEEEK